MKIRNWIDDISENYILAAILLIFLFFGLTRIGNVGVQYDEILFGNAALGKIDNTFIAREFLGIPTLLMAHIGALKAYLYYPIFALFGVSAETIRIPAVILTLFSAFALYLLSAKIFGKKTALLAVLFFALSPSVIQHTRYDVGPNAIELFLKIISLYLVLLLSQTRKLRYAALPVLAVFAGVFNKLNFIWFLNGLLVSLTVLHFKPLLNLEFQAGKRELKLPLILSAGFGLSYLYCFSAVGGYNASGYVSLSALKLNFAVVSNNLIGVLDGTAFYNYAFGNLQSVWAPFFVWAVILIITAGFPLSIRSSDIRNSQKTRYYHFILLNLVLTVVQIYFTGLAIASWHALTIFPFISIAMAYSLRLLYDFCKKRLKFEGLRLTAAFLLIISALTAYNIGINLKYVSACNFPPKNHSWSAEIYNLINYAKERPEKFISLDWGTHTQLIAFTGAKNKFYELLWILNGAGDAESRKILFENCMDGADNLFIMHSPETSSFINPRNNFFETVKEHNLEAQKVKEFRESGGRVIFEIYRVGSPLPSSAVRQETGEGAVWRNPDAREEAAPPALRIEPADGENTEVRRYQQPFVLSPGSGYHINVPKFICDEVRLSLHCAWPFGRSWLAKTQVNVIILYDSTEKATKAVFFADDNPSGRELRVSAGPYPIKEIIVTVRPPDTFYPYPESAVLREITFVAYKKPEAETAKK